MAKVTNPLNSSNASGSVDGRTFYNWRGRHIVRNRVGPTGPPTARQTYIRAILTSMAQAWSAAMTQLERDAWDAIAATYTVLDSFTGGSVHMTGFNWWCRIGSLLSDQGMTPSTTAADISLYTAPAGLSSISVSSPSAGILTITVGGDSSGSLDIWSAGPLPVGRLAQRSDFVHQAYEPPAWPGTRSMGTTGGAGTYTIMARTISPQGVAGAFLKATPCAVS